MNTTTLSTSVSPELVERVRRIAEEEKRTESAVVSSALELYTRLEPAIRRSFAEMLQARGQGGTAEKLRSAIFRAQWSLLAEEARRFLGQDLSGLSDERILELAEEAVSQTRQELPQ